MTFDFAAIPAALDELWDFSAPAETETKFRGLQRTALAGIGDDEAAALAQDAYLELLTQLARAQGLQRSFEAAHETLDVVLRQLRSRTAHQHNNEKEASRDARDDTAWVDDRARRVHVRYLLERGRVFNSSKARAQALPLFVRAWDVARRVGDDALAVDAAHMVAIAEPSSAAQVEWNLRAMTLAEASTDPLARKWRASLANNLGWAYHDAGRFVDALSMFETALAAREEAAARDKQVRIAQWCVARCLRSLGHIERALAMQEALREANAQASPPSPDGYNFEELGELYLLQGKTTVAREHFALAASALAADPWFVEQEPSRLARIQRLAVDAGHPSA